MGARPNDPYRPERNWRRLLGPPNSWRRVVLTGVAGGVALALVASLIAAAAGGGGGGSLNRKQSTPISIAGSSDVADSSQPPAAVPVDTPIEDVPTDVPTDVPVEIPTEELATEEPVVPTDTPVEEVPTDVPPAAE